MKIIAHRCGTDKFAEQTIQAAENSLSLGADYVEVDIRFTADNVPVVIHDSSPERLYGERTPVCRMTASHFLSMRRTADKSVCGHLFEDYISCGIEKMLFHCKEGGERLLTVVKMCKNAGILGKVCFGVQSTDDVKLIKSCGDIEVLAFLPKGVEIEKFALAGADYIRLWQGNLTDENIERVKSTGKKLWIMAKNGDVGEVGDGDYELFLNSGADGVLVNRVAPAIEFFKGK